MTLEEEFFKRCNIITDKLADFGFKKTSKGYSYEQLFMDDNFKAIINVDLNGKISAKVVDMENNEEYLPLRFEYNKSAYAGIVKANYEKILQNIKDKCSSAKYFIYPQTNRIYNLILKNTETNVDFPWTDYEGYAVFRKPKNQKWFALIMNIDKSKIDKAQNGEVEVINIKQDKEKIPLLLNKKGYYPAYHMNKKNWITIILDETLSDNEVLSRISESYNLI